MEHRQALARHELVPPTIVVEASASAASCRSAVEKNASVPERGIGAPAVVAKHPFRVRVRLQPGVGRHSRRVSVRRIAGRRPRSISGGNPGASPNRACSLTFTRLRPSGGARVLPFSLPSFPSKEFLLEGAAYLSL